MDDKYYQIQIGDTATIEHIVTEKDVETFSELTGDVNPLHTDDSYAGSVGFGKRVVHGMLTASFISTIIGTKLPGPGALWYEQKLQFLKPVRINEKIIVHATVVKKSEANRMLVIDTTIFADNQDKIVSGEAKVKLLKQNSGAKAMKESIKRPIIISGASRGIGAEIAYVLSEAGHPVIINCNSSIVEAETVSKSIIDRGNIAKVAIADIRDELQVAELIINVMGEFGSIGGIVHCATGPVSTIPFLHRKWQDFQNDIDVHVKGAFNLFSKALPYLVEQRSGLLISIGSTYMDNIPPQHVSSYVAAKLALYGLTKSIAADFGANGVRAIMISPSMANTTLINNVPEKAKILAKMQTPLRRLCEPNDVANLVTALFDEKLSFITGQNFRVNGGSTML